MLISKQIVDEICSAYNIADLAAQIFHYIYIDTLIECFEPDDDNGLPFKLVSQECISYIKNYPLSSNMNIPTNLQKKTVQWTIFQEMFSKM